MYERHDVPCASWQQVDQDLGALAFELGTSQSPREAQFVAALDELTRAGWDVPTEAEALEAVEEL